MKKFTKETFLLLALVFFSAYQGIVITVISSSLSQIYIAIFMYAVAALLAILGLAAKPKREIDIEYEPEEIPPVEETTEQEIQTEQDNIARV